VRVRSLLDRVVRSRRDGKLVMYSLTPVGRSLLDVVMGEEARVKS
jgi:DNA-binding HxlR family transcriptional regulator